LHGQIERYDQTLCSAIMVELWTRKREGDIGGNNLEDMSEYQKSGE
jgi:hypothetical protein